MNQKINRQTDKIVSDVYWHKNANLFARLYTTFRPMSIPNKLFLIQRQNIVRQYCITEPDVVAADIGCGSGEFSEELALKFKKVVAVDYSEMMLDIAKINSRADNIDFHQAGSDNLPIEELSIDQVFALGLFDYLDDPSATLKEIYRVLKPNSIAIITMPKSPSLFEPLRWSRSVRGHLFNIPPIISIMSRKSLRDFVEKENFIIEDIKSLWTTMWIAIIRKK